MKKQIFNICLILMILLIFCGCSSTNISYSNEKTTKVEQPHLYYKDIECIVTKCDYQYWYASGCHYKAYVTVYNEEYNLEKSFTLNGMDAKECESLNNGDIITCELYTWVLDSTSEVIKREINCLK